MTKAGNDRMNTSKQPMHSHAGSSAGAQKTIEAEKHIDALDGVRAIAMIFIVWFHFWQQTWLTPYVTLPEFVTKYIGLKEFYLEGFVRCGYIFVDLMILLSAVCNFYPYARSILLGEEWPDTRAFYKKRFARIMPSYLLALAAMFCITLAEHGYTDSGFMMKDLLSHLFCVQPFSENLLFGTKFSGVLWTVQIEILYYLLMPWIAKAAKKAPLGTIAGLWLFSYLSIRYFLTFGLDKARFYNNHMFAYAVCYGNGLLICFLYIRLRQSGLCDKYGNLASIVMFLLGGFVLNGMVHQLMNTQGVLQVVQLEQRMGLSMVFSVMVLSVMLSGRWGRRFFSNFLFRFISGISYNLYIWHQYIAVKLKEYRIPFWEGDTPPNMTGDTAWSWQYQGTVLVTAILVAFVLTYAFEVPAARKIRKALKVHK